jgi:hypothetical protein
VFPKHRPPIPLLGDSLFVEIAESSHRDPRILRTCEWRMRVSWPSCSMPRAWPWGSQGSYAWGSWQALIHSRSAGDPRSQSLFYCRGSIQMRFTGSDPNKHSSDPNKLFGRSGKENNRESIQTNMLSSRVTKVGISHPSKYFPVKSIHTG